MDEVNVTGGTGAEVCCVNCVDVCCCCSCSARYSASSASEREKEEASPNLPPTLPPGMPPTALSSKSALDMEAR